MANLRLKGVDTDVLVTAYEPILIKYAPQTLNFESLSYIASN